MNNRLFAALMLFIALCFVALAAFAGDFTVRNTCTPNRYVQKGSDLLIYCPGQPATPRYTIKNCAKARVTWDWSKTRVKVRCGAA